MLLVWKGAAAVIAPTAFAFTMLTGEPSALAPQPEIVTMAPAAFAYRQAGEFIEGGRPVDAPRITLQGQRLTIMKHQVSASEYAACVSDGVCTPQPRSAPLGDMPAVQVNWNDANAYAWWLSQRTGSRWRLPTDEEWTFAAAEHASDDALIVSDANNPALRWLARYDKEFASATNQRLAPRGSGRSNARGVADLAGPVWEWTSTCFARVTRDQGEDASVVNCGVRIVQGEHRSYMTDFIRDPKTGGCAVGKPPSHLGFRLVREEDGFAPRLQRSLKRLLESVS